MPHAFADIAFTPDVQAAQEHLGSRAAFARSAAEGGEVRNALLGAREAEFIAHQRSFYLATVSETGWPYVQHRGGRPGFLKVVDAKTLAFADYAGNRQLVSVGNAAGNDRVALILVDYQHQMRLKILGHLSVRDALPEERVSADSDGPQVPVQRVMTIAVAAFDWNCPQHIPQRFEAADVEALLERKDAEIARLRLLLAERAA